MKVLDEGHRFELASLDGDSAIQVLQFVKREGPGYPGNVGHYPGTTSQEVDRALLSRAVYVNGQIPCWQTRVSIWLRAAIIWLYEHRAARRHGRKAPGLYAAVYGETCKKCGHAGCKGLCH
jgi:hypothetical protein